MDISFSQRQGGLLNLTNQDRTVCAVVGVEGETLRIYDWRSKKAEGMDITAQALSALREKFLKVVVYGIGGSPEDGSSKYWRYLFHSGLVDQLFDDNLVDVTPVSKVARRQYAGNRN